MARKTKKIEKVEPVEQKEERVIEINLKPKTNGQYDYLRSILEHDITICTGPPGCGKSYISVGVGLKKVFEEKTHKKMIISRPTVYEGKGMGFLPGTISEKMSPYLMPIYNCAKEFMRPDFLNGKVGVGDYNKDPQIEIVPVCFMTGMTFKDSIILVDEAQNCSFNELRTIITRLGEGSKLIISGDIKQAVEGENLTELKKRMRHILNVGIVEMTNRDIQRHPRLGEIIDALGG